MTFQRLLHSCPVCKRFSFFLNSAVSDNPHILVHSQNAWKIQDVARYVPGSSLLFPDAPVRLLSFSLSGLAPFSSRSLIFIRGKIFSSAPAFPFQIFPPRSHSQTPSLHFIKRLFFSVLFPLVLCSRPFRTDVADSYR